MDNLAVQKETDRAVKLGSTDRNLQAAGPAQNLSGKSAISVSP
jgi:hypothetical protein